MHPNFINYMEEEKAMKCLDNESTKRIEEYILNIGQDDVDSLKYLYDETRHILFGYALSIVKNRHDAEDILHDTYIQVHRYANKYTSAFKPLAWLLTITKNLCLAKLNEDDRKSDLSYEEWENNFKASEGISAEDKNLLYQCINTLEEPDKQIVILHSLSGYKHNEIAELLDISTNTVISKYNRAIKKLSEYVKGKR